MCLGDPPSPEHPVVSVRERHMKALALASRCAVAAVVIGTASCGGDSGAGQLDVNSLLADAAGEHGLDHASQDVGAQGGDGSNMSLINTTGDVPDIDMIDISTGAAVNLRSLIDNTKPLLFWFWAPH